MEGFLCGSDIDRPETKRMIENGERMIERKKIRRKVKVGFDRFHVPFSIFHFSSFLICYFSVFCFLSVIFLTGCSAAKGTADVAWGVTKVGTKAAWETTKFVGRGIKTTVNIIGGKAVVPLHRRGNSMFVSARVNGVSAILLVDTGATRTQISRSFAKRLGIDLRRADPVMIRTADGRGIEARQVYLREIRVGQAVVKNVSAVVFVNGKDKEYDGLLGMTFLNEFIFQIDSQKGELILKKR